MAKRSSSSLSLAKAQGNSPPTAVICHSGNAQGRMGHGDELRWNNDITSIYWTRGTDTASGYCRSGIIDRPNGRYPTVSFELSQGCRARAKTYMFDISPKCSPIFESVSLPQSNLFRCDCYRVSDPTEGPSRGWALTDATSALATLGVEPRMAAICW